MAPLSQRKVHLDLCRGLAALFVVLGHLRGCLFSPLPDGAQLPFGESLFLFTTSLQAQAVSVFFVLSGYFIGGSVVTGLKNGKWSWLRYTTNRLTRLWCVLFPALVLTCLLDTLGLRIGDHAYYHGARDGFSYFLGNLFFLQTIAFRVYGSNGPLWSLAYEFWYYVLFPLAYWGIVSKAHPAFRAASLLLAGLLLWTLPPLLVSGGLVWLMGLGAWLCVSNNSLRKFTGSFYFFLASACLFIWFLGHGFNGDFMKPDDAVGITFAGMIPFLASRNDGAPWYQGLSKFLSEISYTLYANHFPILAFVFFGLRVPYETPLSMERAPLFAALFCFLLIFSRGWWFLFEKRTGQLRKMAEERLIPLFKRDSQTRRPEL